jgi:hypothetical protein
VKLPITPRNYEAIIKDYLELFGIIWDYLELFGIIWNYMGLFGIM